MINIKTTIGAVVTLLAGLAPLCGVDISVEIQTAMMTVGIAIVGIFAKDSNVTGGTKRQ